MFDIMGISTSTNTRKLTVENPHPNNAVVHVSEDVVRRINNHKDAKMMTKRPSDRNNSVQTASPDQPHPPQSHLHEIRSSIQIEQANLLKLKKNDEYWQNRLNGLERKYSELSDKIETEYKRTVMEAERDRTLLKPSSKRTITTDGAGDNSGVKPIQVHQKNVQECYNSNPKETMKCSNLVQEFVKCVDAQRLYFQRAHPSTG